MEYLKNKDHEELQKSFVKVKASQSPPKTFEKFEKLEKPEKPEKSGKYERTEKYEKYEKPERPEKDSSSGIYPSPRTQLSQKSIH